jgi:hypothetical protein
VTQHILLFSDISFYCFSRSSYLFIGHCLVLCGNVYMWCEKLNLMRPFTSDWRSAVFSWHRRPSTCRSKFILVSRKMKCTWPLTVQLVFKVIHRWPNFLLCILFERLEVKIVTKYKMRIQHVLFRDIKTLPLDHFQCVKCPLNSHPFYSFLQISWLILQNWKLYGCST